MEQPTDELKAKRNEKLKEELTDVTDQMRDNSEVSLEAIEQMRAAVVDDVNDVYVMTISNGDKSFQLLLNYIDVTENFGAFLDAAEHFYRHELGLK